MSALPVIPRAEFKHLSPFISKTPLTLRAFTGGLEEVLAQAKDTGSTSDQTAALEQVVRDCCLTQFDVGNAPIFAIQEIFMRLREKSVGEKQDLKYLCKNKVKTETGEKTCEGEVPFTLNYQDFKVVTPEGHKVMFDLPGGYVIKFRYPCLNDYQNGYIDKTTSTNTVLATLFDSLSLGDEVWSAADFSREEHLNFIKGIGTKEKAEIADLFITRMPKLFFGAEQTCPKCGFNHKLSFSGIKDVFQ